MNYKITQEQVNELSKIIELIPVSTLGEGLKFGTAISNIFKNLEEIKEEPKKAEVEEVEDPAEPAEQEAVEEPAEEEMAEVMPTMEGVQMELPILVVVEEVVFLIQVALLDMMVAQVL